MKRATFYQIIIFIGLALLVLFLLYKITTHNNNSLDIAVSLLSTSAVISGLVLASISIALPILLFLFSQQKHDIDNVFHKITESARNVEKIEEAVSSKKNEIEKIESEIVHLKNAIKCSQQSIGNIFDSKSLSTMLRDPLAIPTDPLLPHTNESGLICDYNKKDTCENLYNHYDLVLKNEPTNYNAIIHKALASFYLSRHLEAENLLTQTSFSSNAKLFEAQSNLILAEIEIRNCDLKKAEEHLKIAFNNFNESYEEEDRYASVLPIMPTYYIKKGDIKLRCKLLDRAKEYYEKCLLSLEDSRVEVNKVIRANCYRRLGDLYLAQKEYNKANTNYSTAEQLYNEADIDLGKMTIYICKADCYRIQHNFGLAKNEYENALHLSERIKHRSGIANSLLGLAMLEHVIENSENVQLKYFQALMLFDATGQLLGRARTLELLGFYEYGIGNVVTACQYYETALKIYEKLGEEDTIDRVKQELKRLQKILSVIHNC